MAALRRRKVARDRRCIDRTMKATIPDLDIHERRILGSGLLALSLSLAGWSTASLWFAADHMARLGAICGEAVPHCGWCVSAVFGAAAALAAAWFGLRLVAGFSLTPAPGSAR